MSTTVFQFTRKWLIHLFHQLALHKRYSKVKKSELIGKKSVLQAFYSEEADNTLQYEKQGCEQ